MPPELHILGLVLLFYAVAYLAIYPRLVKKTLKRLMGVDAVLMLILLGIAATGYYGTNTSFTLLFFETWWWVYTLALALIIETPLFLWFARKWDIDLTNLDE